MSTPVSSRDLADQGDGRLLARLEDPADHGPPAVVASAGPGAPGRASSRTTPETPGSQSRSVPIPCAEADDEGGNRHDGQASGRRARPADAKGTRCGRVRLVGPWRWRPPRSPRAPRHPPDVPTTVPMTVTPSWSPSRTTPPPRGAHLGDRDGRRRHGVRAAGPRDALARRHGRGRGGDRCRRQADARARGPGTLAMQQLDVQVAMSTYPVRDGHEPGRLRPRAGVVRPRLGGSGATDSAAAATALATGVKTADGMVGVDSGRRGPGDAGGAGDRAGPLGGAGHRACRSATRRRRRSPPTTSPARRPTAIAHGLLASNLSVVIGAGHPWYDDNHQRLDAAGLRLDLRRGLGGADRRADGFTFVDDSATLNALASGRDAADAALRRAAGGVHAPGTPRRRPADARTRAPRNAVPDLATLSLAALDVLGQDPEATSSMVEGGAIDWASHDHDTARTIEEVLDFDARGGGRRGLDHRARRVGAAPCSWSPPTARQAGQQVRPARGAR